jgi:Nucleotidyltransferase domain
MDPRVRHIVEGFCGHLYDVRPGLVETVYATGSALTGDWQPLHSDIDVVLVVSRPVSVDDERVLSELHAATARDDAHHGNPIDGVYLTATQLAAGPDQIETAPQVVDGLFVLDKPHGQLNWVTWLELAASPVGRIDPASGEMSWSAPAGTTPEVAAKAAEFSRENLATFWAGTADQIEAWLAGPEAPEDETAPVPDEAVVWSVLAAPRLVATIERGRVLSKFDSGEFARERWPSYAELIQRCQRSRSGQPEVFTVADVRDGLGLLREVVDARRTVSRHGV